MRTILTIVIGLIAMTGWAQSEPTKASPAKAKTAATNSVELAAPALTVPESLSVKTMQALEQSKPEQPKPNEIKTETGVYSGVVPHIAKTDNPLQLINPAAPKEYGHARDNTSVDVITGRPQGIKLFSFSWFSSDKKKAKAVPTTQTTTKKPDLADK